CDRLAEGELLIRPVSGSDVTDEHRARFRAAVDRVDARAGAKSRESPARELWRQALSHEDERRQVGNVDGRRVERRLKHRRNHEQACDSPITNGLPEAVEGTNG